MRSRLALLRRQVMCWLSVIAFYAGLSGCGGPPRADYGSLGLVEISGTITLDGQPLPGASIRFIDADQTYATGVTDQAGHYTMMLDSVKSGVIPGKKTVHISSRAPVSEEGAADAEEPAPAAKPAAAEKVPACYNKNSLLKINVTKSDSALDFALKSDGAAAAYP